MTFVRNSELVASLGKVQNLV